VVLIHDAARPLVSASNIRSVVDALNSAEGAAPALAMADSLKTWDGDRGPVAGAARDGLWRVQTPQGFRRNVIEAAYGLWSGDAVPTDDLAVLEGFGGHAVLVPGDPLLMKLTYPEDFLMAERLAGAARITRIGQGFDVHRFGPGDGVWLCGLKIPHDGALVGHSDADACLHALTDALLGAIGEGDIGDHFPPTDPTWKGVASDIFLRHAAKLIAGRGGEIINVDLTLICEAPKIKPHRQAMRERVSEILGLALDRVSIKATTTEELGFTGRREGLAAQAVAAVALPI
jgi:2-C-methyl-D-erythritol 4-phosphate cytidylyltransferase/2-C-methyl-D-erythritol 2,4-cyclodiphosphate synthase